MKIFFVSQTFSKIFKHRYFSTVFISVLFLSLLVSQLVLHLDFSSQPTTSPALAESGFYVTLDISGNVPENSAKIFLNGEEYAPLNSSSVLINLEKASVIEIFCQNDCEFSVSVRPSQGTCVTMADDKLLCRKGMNYICRCFFEI